MSHRAYEGDPLDGTYQHISESPVWGPDGETVDATPDPDGEETVENVPVPEADVERPDADGQTTLDDWGWSA
ncbi:hypothetical protein [Haloarcula pellucida]|uniref:hypothetical protein n=1 Tax=Haloarcula pellucida TaxID=1427151 RepID=UPI0016699852|nr:hypothetical protein [Halomicroarcula pellucida]MBX0350366.1 hypothetical protein [Halomicroarcula pellucida]